MTDQLPGLDAAGFAAIIGKTTYWVEKNARNLPHHRIGRSIRFFDDDLADYLAETKRRPATEGADDFRPLPSRRRSA